MPAVALDYSEVTEFLSFNDEKLAWEFFTYWSVPGLPVWGVSYTLADKDLDGDGMPRQGALTHYRTLAWQAFSARERGGDGGMA